MNCPCIEQLAPSARLDPQLLANSNEDASAPVATMLLTARIVFSLLVSGKDLELLDMPITVGQKVRLVADSVNDGSTPILLNTI